MDKSCHIGDFFFQAEDGIRDGTVTGVQTCALPIYLLEIQKELVEEKQKEILDSIHYAKRIQFALLASDSLLNTHLPEHFVLRSEERRVGKECRSRWWRYDSKR